MIAGPKTIDATIAFRDESQLYRLAFGAMGTDCSIQFACDDRETALAFAREAVKWVADFETRYSRFRDSSLLTRINQLAGSEPVPLDPEASRIFEICQAVYESSGGLLDATVLPLQALWNGPEQQRAPTPQAIASARALVGWDQVIRDQSSIYLPRPGMRLDLGGWGKEYAVDQTAAIARRHGISDFLIDYGRDIRASGRPPLHPTWKIGVEDPDRPDSALFCLYINDAAVATSGGYRRYADRDGKRCSHIIDPRSGYPADNGIKSATAVAATCLRAGELSTCACILGEAEGLAHLETSGPAEGCLIGPRGLIATDRFHRYAELTERIH